MTDTAIRDIVRDVDTGETRFQPRPPAATWPSRLPNAIEVRPVSVGAYSREEKLNDVELVCRNADYGIMVNALLTEDDALVLVNALLDAVAVRREWVAAKEAEQ